MFASIIVPVYNSEKFIGRCIKSVLLQSIDNWELILIDDGSKDSSGVICDNYAIQDKRIKVHHIVNGGVSNARNIGMENAEGDYIIFLDSDDFVDSNCLEKVYYLFKQYQFDILQYSIVRVYEGKVFSVNSIDIPLMSGIDYLKTERGLLCAGGNIIKRALIGTNRFPVGIRYGEDRMFLLRTIEKAENVMRTSSINYYYEDNPNSASQTPQTNAVIDSIKSTLKMIEEFPYLKNYFNSVIVGYVLSIIRNNDVKYKSYKKVLETTDIFYSKRLRLQEKIYVIMNKMSCRLTYILLSVLFVLKKKYGSKKFY